MTKADLDFKVAVLEVLRVLVASQNFMLHIMTGGAFDPYKVAAVETQMDRLDTDILHIREEIERESL